MPKNIQNSIQYLKGVGPRRAEIFKKIGINTIEDLLWYFPRDYVDRNLIHSLKALRVKLQQESIFEEGNISEFIFKQEVMVVGRIVSYSFYDYARNKRLLKFLVEDLNGGRAELLFWNYTDYYSKLYHIGDLVTIMGVPVLSDNRVVQFNHPELEKFDDKQFELYEKGQILPVYRLPQELKSAKISNRILQKLVANALETKFCFEETLPDYLLRRLGFDDVNTTIRALHYPRSKEELEKARRRIKFEEIFYYELLLALEKKNIERNERGVVLQSRSPRARKVYEMLPFKLTGDQKKVMKEIIGDFQNGKPMNRLLQGDVGSGKTIVAVLSMLYVIDNGYQCCFIAPTEILAEQHYLNLLKHCEDLDVNVVQLVGGQKPKLRKEVLEKIASGEANIIVGTHSLFESDVVYRNLAYIVIDEQHRFGVMQRAELKRLGSKSLPEGYKPHILVMSATPIPRTLALTIYGDLDVSVIREMPLNRKQIITKVVFESQLPEIFSFIKKQLEEGRQAFIVYPLVEKSEKLELKSAIEHYEFLKESVFKEYKCGLLHGQMFWYEKDEIMRDFLEKKYDILVATTVIEVGIDIPNATVMLIENAERYGLSQLHQLRGRVGRSQYQSYCFLCTKDKYKYKFEKSKSDDELKALFYRLKKMEETTDGFKIAEYDMQLRGPGDITGIKQAGLPEFNYVNLAADIEIISEARKQAFEVIRDDPFLQKLENQIIKATFLKKYAAEKIYLDIA